MHCLFCLVFVLFLTKGGLCYFMLVYWDGFTMKKSVLSHMINGSVAAIMLLLLNFKEVVPMNQHCSTLVFLASTPYIKRGYQASKNERK